LVRGVRACSVSNSSQEQRGSKKIRKSTETGNEKNRKSVWKVKKKSTGDLEKTKGSTAGWEGRVAEIVRHWEKGKK